MDVLVIGSGGREAAIVWKLASSPRVDRLYCAPGNNGIAKYASCFPVQANDFEGIIDLAKSLAVDLVFVAPDEPLALGLVDRLEASGIRAFGPTAAAAQIESSKSFAKELMRDMRIPTARFKAITSHEEALDYAKTCALPVVVKCDGLALGKGVLICHTRDEVLAACQQIMGEKVFGDAGKTILFEEMLFGPEVTILAFTDGHTVKLMPSARDHKRAFDGDLGPNTGGMGAVVPGAEFLPEDLREIEETIVKPTLEGLRLRGIQYKGVLYFGLMLTKDGPKVIEYNARFGDPECQVLMPLLETDLMRIIQSILMEQLSNLEIVWKRDHAACVVLTSNGYPGPYETGFKIEGTLDVKKALVFEAGTKSGGRGITLTSGGRVLNVVATAPSLDEALLLCYEEIKHISFEGMTFRRDIGVLQA